MLTLQIAVDEAVPYGELKLNPYTVMCATSLGGHLAFYEPGGGRWHPKPICNFLHKMATEVDLKAIPREEHITTNESNILHFDPMRRKMDLLRAINHLRSVSYSTCVYSFHRLERIRVSLRGQTSPPATSKGPRPAALPPSGNLCARPSRGHGA